MKKIKISLIHFNINYTLKFPPNKASNIRIHRLGCIGRALLDFGPNFETLQKDNILK